MRRWRRCDGDANGKEGGNRDVELGIAIGISDGDETDMRDEHCNCFLDRRRCSGSSQGLVC